MSRLQSAFSSLLCGRWKIVYTPGSGRVAATTATATFFSSSAAAGAAFFEIAFFSAFGSIMVKNVWSEKIYIGFLIVIVVVANIIVW